MRATLILAPLLLVAAAGVPADRPLDPATQAKLDKALAGYVAGKPTSCLPLGSQLMSTSTYGRILVYRQGGRTLFVNDTGGGCEGAERGDTLVSIQHQGRACSGDIIQTVDITSRIPTGSCALRDFVPYTKAK